MALENDITGNVTGKIRFTIDKASWNNLDKFQKKLTSVKRQMTDLNKTINVNAVVKSVDTVAKAHIKADNAVVQSKVRVANVMEKHLNKQQRNMLNMQKKYIQDQQRLVKNANKNAGMGDRLSWLFPSNRVSNKASSTVFAQQLRDEAKKVVTSRTPHAGQSAGGVGLEFGKATGADRTYAQWWQDSLKAQDARERKLEQLLNERDRRNIARRKRKGRSMAASSLMQERFNVESQLYLKTKLGQFASYAELNNLSADKRAAGFSRIREGYQNSIGKNTGANYGDLQRFKNDLQGVTRELLTQERVARKNAISFASMRNELVQLTAAYGAFQTVANIAKTGFEFEGLRAAAKVFAKDDAGVAEHMSFIRDQAYLLGIDLKTATKEFTKFSIATKSTLSNKQQREIFVGISQYARVLGVNQQDYERAFRAVQQIECCLPTQ